MITKSPAKSVYNANTILLSLSLLQLVKLWAAWFYILTLINTIQKNATDNVELK